LGVKEEKFVSEITSSASQAFGGVTGKRDLPWELVGRQFAFPNGKKGRVIGFSSLYESEVMVGVIAGEEVVCISRPPVNRLLKRNGKVVGSLMETPRTVDGKIECRYETYTQVFPRASAPLRRELLESGVDIPQLRARMRMLCTQTQLPIDTPLTPERRDGADDQ
jgi:hypothetical protein